ncbi:glycosyltransferase family 4 protein [Shewanella cyperi]|uniref:Glycosyltransferase family 4 protein n=1 Tax=Shewanella cyperi TaxID=2814292 RepID=A0A974XIA1_9GAMM|nr:glycosyltransferase family 4 protein [Shewanella cyperi]QSX28910.1 glycosyltransferase family 4 protein [Shewanella cyperi]
MKSILIVAPSDIYGGGEVYIKNFVHYLKEQTTVKVIVGVCHQRLRDELKDVADVTFTVKPSVSLPNKLINTQIINYYSLRYGVDVVFLNGLPESALFAFLLVDRNVVCIGHSNEQHLKVLPARNGINASVLKLLFRLSFKKLKLFIAINKVAEANVQAFIPLYRRIRVIYNGVPAINPQYVNEQNAVPLFTAPFVVGRICRLTADKNVELAIDSVRQTGSDIPLIIAGEGPHQAALVAYCGSSSANIHFMGHCNAADFFSQIDVMLLTTPSTGNADATPLVILEAMSAGVPVIATRVGGVPELISHMHTGLLCDDDPFEFAKAINLLKQDRHLLQSISSNAKLEYQRRFSPSVTFAETTLMIKRYCGLGVQND